MAWYVFLIPIVALICVFTFISIETWAENRRKERESYHKNETLQKMLDGSPESTESVRQVIREEEELLERRRLRSRKQGLLLGGSITAAVGLGLGVFLYGLASKGEPVYLVGLIPFLIGVVLLVFGAFTSAPEA